MRYIECIFNLSRRTKRTISLILDSLFFYCAFWGALIVHIENLDIFSYGNFWALSFVLLPLNLIVFLNLGLYRSVLRFMGYQSLGAILIGSAISSFVLFIANLVSGGAIPAGVPVIYLAFLVIFMGGSRLIVRGMLSQNQRRNKKEKVVIYGAGSSGRQLAQSLMHGQEYDPIAFIEDDNSLHFQNVQGRPVYPSQHLPKLLSDHKSVKRVLLAMPSIPRSARNRIITNLECLPVEVLTIPGMSDLVKGTSKIDEIAEVQLSDILGRDPVPPHPKLLTANITSKTVMVTGAGGSIGSELCRQISQQQPKALVLLELCEYALYQIEKELRKYIAAQKLDIELYPILGTVQNRGRMSQIMASFGVQTVYHAAAYKHVPLVEHNVIEGIRNNVFGTLQTAEAAIESGVETFVLISTDKAVRPTNVMGASKRLAELGLQSLTKRQKDTRFCMVRFGNVLGSSGSVVPLFREQIKHNGPVTVTHPDITRYFMTIPEASQLVIQAGAMGHGGEVFVLDMGPQVRIADLARKMIRLSGLTIQDDRCPDGDIAIQFTGLRPGEKLYEELLVGDDVHRTSHSHIMKANEVSLGWTSMEKLLEQLDTECLDSNINGIYQILTDAPIGFSPTDPINDLVSKRLDGTERNQRNIIEFQTDRPNNKASA